MRRTCSTVLKLLPTSRDPKNDFRMPATEEPPIPNRIIVLCQKNGASQDNWTEGKRYVAVHYMNRLYRIFDDKNTTRLVTPDEPSPHLSVRNGSGESYPVGMFVTIAGGIKHE